MKDQQFYISVFVDYLTFPSSSYKHQPRHDTVIQVRMYGRFIGIQTNLRRKNLHRINQSSSVLGVTFSNRDNVRALI